MFYEEHTEELQDAKTEVSLLEYVRHQKLAICDFSSWFRSKGSSIYPKEMRLSEWDAVRQHWTETHFREDIDAFIAILDELVETLSKEGKG